VLLPSGKTVPLSPVFRQHLETKFGEMAVRPLRCLAFALKDGKDLGDLANFGEVLYLQLLDFPPKLNCFFWVPYMRAVWPRAHVIANVCNNDNGESKQDEDPALHPEMKDPKKFAAIESDLTFVGLAGIKVSFIRL
jgi:hypothetical protein